MKIEINKDNYQSEIARAGDLLSVYDDIQLAAWQLLLDCAQEAFLSE